MQKIGRNSINLFQIPTKSGAKMCLSKPFMYTEFQFDLSMCLCVMAEFASVQNKGEKIRAKFWLFISQDLLG